MAKTIALCLALAAGAVFMAKGAAATFAEDQTSSEPVELAPAERRAVAYTGEVLPATELHLDYTAGRVILSGDPAPSSPFGADDRLVIEVTRPDGTVATWDRTFEVGCYQDQPIPAEDVTSLFQPGLNIAKVTVSDVCGGSVGTLGRVMLSGVSLVGSAPPPPPNHGPSLFPLAWLAACAVLIGGVGIFVLRHRRALPETVDTVSATEKVILSRPVTVVTERTALIALVDATPGGNLGGSRTFEVGWTPMTIGWGERCDIRVPEVASVGREHARVWVRDGRLMVHHLAPGLTTVVSGQPVTWASVDQGDDIGIGPYTFHCLQPGAPQSA